MIAAPAGRELQRPSAEEALLRSAMAMTGDAEVARALVGMVMETALEAEARKAPLGTTELFRLLRQAYHSVGRSHSRRRVRDGMATAVAAHSGEASGRADG